MVQQILSALDPVPPPDPDGDAMSVLTDHLNRILTRFETARDEFVVLKELYARAGRDPELHAALLANDEGWAGFLRQLFAAGQERGQFRANLDPDAATAIVIGFLKSLLFQLDLTAERTRRVADELLRAVAAPSIG